MTADIKPKKTIGHAEEIALPEIGVSEVVARIDTGARTSAIWVSEAKPTDRGLEVLFFGPSSPYYSGQPIVFEEFEKVVVASSNGATEQRFKVKLLVRIAGRRIRAWFTLADRSTQVYPILIGRNVLRGKFIVDVTKGTLVLREAERERTRLLNQQITEES
ncbi:MAG: RimK/LysX family protein [Candidatus Saccharimonadales bacterium]